MANSLLPSRAPSCLNCLRHSLLEDFSTSSFQNPSRMQWRGKKKLPKATTIPVRLLENITRYGTKGSVIAVPPATMRNLFFPNNRAAYLTMTERKAIGPAVKERDYTFGLKTSQLKKKGTSIDDDLLSTRSPSSSTFDPQFRFSISPARRLELLQKFIPPVIEFFRPMLQTPAITPQGKQDPNTVDGGIPTTAIYTPVTNADVAARVMSYLADGASAGGESQAARVAVEPKDVKFVSGTKVEGSEGAGAVGEAEFLNRVKSLGEFEFRVMVTGGNEIKRVVRILPEAAPAEVLENPAQELTL